MLWLCSNAAVAVPALTFSWHWSQFSNSSIKFHFLLFIGSLDSFDSHSCVIFDQKSIALIITVFWRSTKCWTPCLSISQFLSRSHSLTVSHTASQCYIRLSFLVQSPYLFIDNVFQCVSGKRCVSCAPKIECPLGIRHQFSPLLPNRMRWRNLKNSLSIESGECITEKNRNDINEWKSEIVSQKVCGTQ